jgi:hypothetical protein
MPRNAVVIWLMQSCRTTLSTNGEGVSSPFAKAIILFCDSSFIGLMTNFQSASTTVLTIACKVRAARCLPNCTSYNRELHFSNISRPRAHARLTDSDEMSARSCARNLSQLGVAGEFRCSPQNHDAAFQCFEPSDRIDHNRSIRLAITADGNPQIVPDGAISLTSEFLATRSAICSGCTRTVRVSCATMAEIAARCSWGPRSRSNRPSQSLAA